LRRKENVTGRKFSQVRALLSIRAKTCQTKNVPAVTAMLCRLRGRFFNAVFFVQLETAMAICGFPVHCSSFHSGSFSPSL
jgi:hypothetical protein